MLHAQSVVLRNAWRRRLRQPLGLPAAVPVGPQGALFIRRVGQRLRVRLFVCDDSRVAYGVAFIGRRSYAHDIGRLDSVVLLRCD